MTGESGVSEQKFNDEIYLGGKKSNAGIIIAGVVVVLLILALIGFALFYPSDSETKKSSTTPSTTNTTNIILPSSGTAGTTTGATAGTTTGSTAGTTTGSTAGTTTGTTTGATGETTGTTTGTTTGATTDAPTTFVDDEGNVIRTNTTVVKKLIRYVVLESTKYINLLRISVLAKVNNKIVNISVNGKVKYYVNKYATTAKGNATLFTNDYVDAGKYFHSELNGFIVIDLQEPYELYRIILYNRVQETTPWMIERIQAITIKLYDTPTTPPTLADGDLLKNTMSGLSANLVSSLKLDFINFHASAYTFNVSPDGQITYALENKYSIPKIFADDPKVNFSEKCFYIDNENKFGDLIPSVQTNNVVACAKEAKKLGTKVFGIIDGKCYASSAGNTTYDKTGLVDCPVVNGGATITGTPNTMAVWEIDDYKIANNINNTVSINNKKWRTRDEMKAAELLKLNTELTPTTSGLCFADRAARALRTNIPSAHNNPALCGAEAKKLGSKIFGMQNGGECWVDADAVKRYDMYGLIDVEETPCNEKGGGYVNNIWTINEEVPKDYLKGIVNQKGYYFDGAESDIDLWKTNEDIIAEDEVKTYIGKVKYIRIFQTKTNEGGAYAAYQRTTTTPVKPVDASIDFNRFNTNDPLSNITNNLNDEYSPIIPYLSIGNFDVYDKNGNSVRSLLSDDSQHPSFKALRDDLSINTLLTGGRYMNAYTHGTPEINLEFSVPQDLSKIKFTMIKAYNSGEVWGNDWWSVKFNTVVIILYDQNKNVLSYIDATQGYNFNASDHNLAYDIVNNKIVKGYKPEIKLGSITIAPEKKVSDLNNTSYNRTSCIVKNDLFDTWIKTLPVKDTLHQAIGTYTGFAPYDKGYYFPAGECSRIAKKKGYKNFAVGIGADGRKTCFTGEDRLFSGTKLRRLVKNNESNECKKDEVSPNLYQIYKRTD